MTLVTEHITYVSQNQAPPPLERKTKTGHL